MSSQEVVLREALQEVRELARKGFLSASEAEAARRSELTLRPYSPCARSVDALATLTELEGLARDELIASADLEGMQVRVKAMLLDQAYALRRAAYVRSELRKQRRAERKAATEEKEEKDGVPSSPNSPSRGGRSSKKQEKTIKLMAGLIVQLKAEVAFLSQRIDAVETTRSSTSQGRPSKNGSRRKPKVPEQSDMKS